MSYVKIYSPFHCSYQEIYRSLRNWASLDYLCETFRRQSKVFWSPNTGLYTAVLRFHSHTWVYIHHTKKAVRLANIWVEISNHTTHLNVSQHLFGYRSPPLTRLLWTNNQAAYQSSFVLEWVRNCTSSLLF